MGLSIQAFSVKVNLSDVMIAEYELGYNSPSFKKALLIARELNFDLDKMLKRKYPKSDKSESGFADNLRAKRRRKKITQEDLANKLDIARSMLSRYENGRYIPNLTTAIKMAEFFKCSLYDFV